MNWSTFDLNLLVVFDAIMEDNNLTRAGQRLGLSQPAVSHALSRLRHALHDDLFVRTPDGMRPTARAERMAGPVRAALQELRLSLESDEFDPSTAARSFTIAANNYAARAVIPGLAKRVAQLAASITLDVRPIGLLHALDQLDAGTVELVLATLIDGSDRFKCVRLLEDEYVVLLSNDHPATADPELSVEGFAALPHIGITSSGDDTHFIDDALAERGLARFVSMRVPLHSLVSVLIGSNAVAVIPRRVAMELVAISPVAARPLPFRSPRFTLSMIWHRRLDNHPAHHWLRNLLRSSVATA